MIFNEQEALDIVKKHADKTEDWVINSRKTNRTLKALVDGENFSEELIERIEFIESADRAKARKRYSKDIRDVFFRVMAKRRNVFDANGGSENILIKNDNLIETFNKKLSSFKNGKSISRYLSENYFKLLDTDPNGGILIEYNKKEEIYPAYKSIQDIRFYESKGQLVEYVLFEPKVISERDVKEWRLIDDLNDWTITQVGEMFLINKDKSFEHPFGEVPFLILSENQKTGNNERLSPLNSIIELAKDYARDKSVLSIYKFLNGFPIHWRYVSQCRTCNGSGRTQEAKCGKCDGRGYMGKGDVTDMVTLPLPKEGQPNIAPNIAGFIKPDLDTWQQYNSDLRDMENIMEDTIWGTDRIHKSQVNESETATGRFIDTQPINTALNYFADIVEFAQNKMGNWLLNFIDPVKSKDEVLYYMSYGRRFIIESPDVLLTKYEEAKNKGCNVLILDKLLEEFVLSKYKSDPIMQNAMLKKAKVEPYVHLSNKEIFDYFGSVEVNKKDLFQKFWQTADVNKTVEQLQKEFESFFNLNKLNQNESM